MKTNENIKLIFSLSQDLKTKIQAFCEERDISASVLCRLAIREYLKNHEQD
jgi:predicted transcriptional regulator